MNLSTEQYNNLAGFAKALCTNQNKLHLDYEDIVNDSLIKAIESGKEYDLNEIKKSIRNAVMDIYFNKKESQ